MLHPAQRICCSPEFLYYAISATIYRYCIASQEISELWAGQAVTSAEKAKNIEHRAVTEMAIYKHYLIWFGEDKILRVLDLRGQTQLLPERELVKRACALCIEDDVIVIGDKFGDVYTYDLVPPDSPELDTVAGENTADTEDAPTKLPILGHVSMLTSLALTPPVENAKRFIVTADRDEHIRISHFPDGHNIHCYCLGHTQFISSLLISSDRLVAGGGDEYLSLWDWRNGTLLERRNMTDAVQLANSQGVGIAMLKMLAFNGLDIVVVLMEGLTKLFLYSLTSPVSGQVDLQAPAMDMTVTGHTLWITYDTERSGSQSINFDCFHVSDISTVSRVPVDQLNANCKKVVEKVEYTIHRAHLMRKRTKVELEAARLISGKGKRKNDQGSETPVDSELQKEIDADKVATEQRTKKTKA